MSIGWDAALRVYKPQEWQSAGVESTQHMERELKAALEGMAKHLFGDVEVLCGNKLLCLKLYP